MGAQKKCQLIVNTVIFVLFSLFFLGVLIYNIYQSYTITNKKKDKLASWVVLIISLIILYIPLYGIINAFRYNIKFILIYKRKKSQINEIENETNNINNINNEGEVFIKRTEYKFKNTIITKRLSNRKVNHKKIVSCVTILSDGKIIFGFSEGTILVCTLDEINCELKQNFSFNKYKLKKILYICESLVNEGEIMVSIKDDFLPIKLIRLNLFYKYSLIKELARDKPYIIFQEIAKNNNNNNNINNNVEENYVFKILAFKNDKYLLCDKKSLLLKEKVHDLNLDEYVSSKEYKCNNEPNEIIHDIIKINEEDFVTLESKNNISNIYFYKLFTLTKDLNYIENVITAESKSNRLCFINESLIAVTDDQCVLFINIILKQKIKVINIENILGIGVDFFYDGGIIFLANKIMNNLNCLNIPYIVKVKKNQGRTEEYKSFSMTNTIQDYKNEKTKINYCKNKINIIKCLKNNGIILLGNDEGKLFIWEEIDINRNHNNSINSIIIN